MASHSHSSGIAIGVFPQFAVPHTTTLVCKEKVWSLSGDDFSVKDANGNTVCSVHGKTLSLHETREFKDPQGNELFKLKKKLLGFRGSHYAERPDGTSCFEVKGHWKLIGSKMTAHFKNAADGKDLEIECNGNWRDKHCEMILVQTGQKVATITRNSMFAVKDVFADKQTYYVQVEPGVDLVLMAALAVTFDERNNDDKD